MEVTSAKEAENDAPWSRIVSGALGLWLFLSTYAWPHGRAEAVNALVCGAIVIDASLASLRIPALQWLVAVVGTWLLASPFVLSSHGVLATWNAIFVGICLVALSMIPSAPWSWSRRRVAYARA